MIKIYLTACVLSIGLIASGCDLLPFTDGGVELTTDRVLYGVATSRINLTVKNKSDHTIYYICTGQIHLEESQGGHITGSWMVHGFEECARQSPIEPGDSKKFEIPFSGDPGLRWLDSAKFDDSVRYRLRFDLFRDKQFRQSLDERNRVSNFFMVHR